MERNKIYYLFLPFFIAFFSYFINWWKLF